MKNKFLKIGLILLLCFIGVTTVFYVYAYIMGKSMQRMPEVQVSDELVKFEKQVKKQIRTNNGGFETIEKHKIDNCNASINLKLYIENDSINNHNIEEYLSYININVNDFLVDKKCFDSLKIKYSINNARDSKGKLIFHYKSFPIR